MFQFNELVAGGKRLLSEDLGSFFIHVDVAVSAANGQLYVNGGFFAALVSRTRPPSALAPSWNSYNYQIDGSDGLGSFSIAHALPRERREVEYINEHSRLYVFEFDQTQPPGDWFKDQAWGAGFAHPLVRENVDQSRYLFHRVSLGEAEDRWAHSFGSRVTPAGTDSTTIVAPFLKPSLLGTVCSRATTGPTRPGYMPTLQAKTYYGQESQPSATWSHFSGTAAQLPGAVSGYVMLAQGGFKSILFDELGSWHMPAADGWTAEKVADRLVEQVGRYPKFRRDLETIGEHGSDSVIRPPADNLPVEVLHLTGLASPLPLF